MAGKKRLASAVVVGDVVGSRESGDRRGLHARLAAVLADVDARLREADPDAVVAPLRFTVGDEYQGSFATLGAALEATRLIRLALLPEVDVRHGIGWGPVEVLAEDPRVEDGPGWWAARAAIEAVKQDAGRAGQRRHRTAYRLAPDHDGPDPYAVNAALLVRDEVVGGLSERSVGVLRGLLGGMTQREIADEQGVSASAISQRVRHDGLATLVAAERLLEEIR